MKLKILAVISWENVYNIYLSFPNTFLVSENNANTTTSTTTDGVTVITKLPLHTCLKTLKLLGLDQEKRKVHKLKVIHPHRCFLYIK